MSSQTNPRTKKPMAKCLMLSEGLERSLMDLRREKIKVSPPEEKCGKGWAAFLKGSFLI